MHLPCGSTNWQELYKKDIEVAEKEFELNHLTTDPKLLIGDIYVLPSDNHQSFYGKLTSENGKYKITFAKTVQKSVWFSENVYMYSISEVKKFEDHPIRHGRIICGCAPIDNGIVAYVRSQLRQLSDEQPEDIVLPSEKAVLTGLQLYENGEVTRRIFYTDAAKLNFIGNENPDAINYLNNLYLKVEKIVGIGE